jgi:hypothetical protein
VRARAEAKRVVPLKGRFFTSLHRHSRLSFSSLRLILVPAAWNLITAGGNLVPFDTGLMIVLSSALAKSPRTAARQKAKRGPLLLARQELTVRVYLAYLARFLFTRLSV